MPPIVVMVVVRRARPAPLGRVVRLAHAAAAGGRAEAHAGPDEPYEEDEADDGTDYDAGYGAAAEVVGVIVGSGYRDGFGAGENPRWRKGRG